MGKIILLSVALALTAVSARATDVVWFDGQHPVSYEVAGKVAPVVKMALQMFEDDMLQVTGTPGFFTIPGNKEMADSCGILIGSSHCEPLLRNNVAEWDAKKRGSYNYITNREQVQQYWTERLQQVKGSEELFTIGMRGIHDGSMEGVKTKQEKLEGLQQVIDDQRELLRKYYHKDVEKVPQVFIPYKEVLEIYESGLRVPDDVTLMWCVMPRDLPVFNPPTVPYLPPADYQPGYGCYPTHPAVPVDAIACNAFRYHSATDGVQPIQMLGHSMNAVSIPKGGEVVYEFAYDQEGEAILYTAMIPDKGDLRYQVTLDNQAPVVISLKEKYRSDFWKQSVLRGQALKQTPVTLAKGKHTLKVKALDDHIILDQWMIDFKKDRKFYVIPTK